MAKKYTSRVSVLIDVMLWSSVFHGQPLTLALLPAIAEIRFKWFVNNWNSLYNRFKALANGNDQDESDLVDLNSAINSIKLGSTINIFSNLRNIAKYWTFLDNISITELDLTPEEQKHIDQEIQRVKNFTIETFQDMRSFLREDMYLQSGEIGLSDPDAARVLGLPVLVKQRSASVEDLDIINNTIELYKYVESIIYAYKQAVDRPPNLLAIANNNISENSDVTINDAFVSYIAKPFEISLESMAQKYLGDSQRWFELVTVNYLQPPYIDEVGTKYPLLAPGASNSVIVSGDAKHSVYVGTKIMIGSRKVREEPRIVEKIIHNSNNTMVLTLSGAQDLVKLQLSDEAFVRVYKPHTVRSGSFILIPTTIPGISMGGATPKSDVLRRIGDALLKFGVDIARTQNGDIEVDPNGNFAMAAGLRNVRQAALYHLKTNYGELPFHPDWGLEMPIGERFYGTNDEVVILAQFLRQTILADPRFTDAIVQDIQVTNTGMAITMLVKIQGLDAPISLPFVV